MPTETEPTCDDTVIPDVPTEEEIPTLPTETTPTETVPTETEPTETVPTETVPTETEPTETTPTETTPTETQPSTGETDCDSPSDDDVPVEEETPGLGGDSDLVSPEPETQPTQMPETQPTQTPETQPTQEPEKEPDTGCGEEGNGDEYVEEETPSFANSVTVSTSVSEEKVEAPAKKVEETPAPKEEVSAPTPEVKSEAPAQVFEEVVVEEAVPVLQAANTQSSAKPNDSLVVKLASFFVNKATDNKNKSKGITYNA